MQSRKNSSPVVDTSTAGGGGARHNEKLLRVGEDYEGGVVYSVGTVSLSATLMIGLQ